MAFCEHALVYTAVGLESLVLRCGGLLQGYKQAGGSWFERFLDFLMLGKVSVWSCQDSLKEGSVSL